MTLLRDTRDLLAHELLGLHAAEQVLIRTLPTVARRVGSPSLREAVEREIETTREQISRLGEARDIVGTSHHPAESRAMEALALEVIDVLTAEGELTVRDAAVVATLQRAAHYQIAGYELAITHAKLLGLDPLVGPLTSCLDEEQGSDEELSDIVELELYEQALGIAPIQR